MSTKRDRRAYWVKVEDIVINTVEGSENLRVDYGSFPADLAELVVHNDDLTDEEIEEIKTALESADLDDIKSMRWLINDIIANGVKNALKGYTANDKHVVVVGNRRATACHIANKVYDANIEDVPFEILHKDRLNPDAILLEQFTENASQKQYTDIEAAKVFSRLIDNGYSEDELATRTGMSVAYIKRIMPLASLYGQATELLQSGAISTHAALTAVKTAEEVEGNPVKAAELASKAIVKETTKAVKQGKKKATADQIEDSIRSSKNEEQIDYAVEGLRELPSVDWDSLPEKVVAQVWKKVSKFLEN